MAEHAGDRQMARMMWSTSYTHEDKNVRASAHTCGVAGNEDVSSEADRHYNSNWTLPSQFF